MDKQRLGGKSVPFAGRGDGNKCTVTEIPTLLGSWSTSNMPGVWKASGQMAPDGYPSTIYATQEGSNFWRIVYVDQLSKTAREIVEPQMTNALFRSAGISVSQ